MPTSSTYPSIPIPTDDIDSIYQSVTAMRQTVQLLIVNSQQITNQTLTKASQIFSKKSDHADISTTVTNGLTTVNKTLSNLSQQVASMQTAITTLQSQVAALEGHTGTTNLDIRMTTAEGNITNLQTRVTALESKFPQAARMQKVTTPFTTNSTSYVMMGISLAALAVSDTQGIVIIDGQLANNTNGHYTNVVVCYGIGTPPIAGAPQTGTILTQQASFQASSGGGSNGSFSLAGIVTGMAIGLSYWFDLAVSVDAGTGTVSNVDATAHVIA